MSRARIGRPPLHISNQGVNAIEDGEEDSDIDSWIYLEQLDGEGLHTYLFYYTVIDFCFEICNRQFETLRPGAFPEALWPCL